jgi:hypothetical protein
MRSDSLKWQALGVIHNRSAEGRDRKARQGSAGCPLRNSGLKFEAEQAFG